MINDDLKEASESAVVEIASGLEELDDHGVLSRQKRPFPVFGFLR